MSDTQLQVTELDVERAKLVQSLAKRLGATPPSSVRQVAEVLNLIDRVRARGLAVVMISHNMEDVRAVADRIVVLRLGRNNGVFTPEASNHELVTAITGAANNSVSRRAGRKQSELHVAQAPA